MVETGTLLPITMDLRTILYLSDKAEERFIKHENDLARAAAAKQRSPGR